MQALILAAGVGSRLALADDRPKCLVEIGGRTLLDRYLDALGALGVPVTIGVGHRAEVIAAHVGDRAHLVTNPDYRLGSVTTLAHSLRALPADVELLLLDGDVFAPASFFSALVKHDGNALLVDIGTEFTDEQYMAGINGGRVRQLRRGPVPGHEQQGEWVGFARLTAPAVAALRAGVEAQVARGDVKGGYEDALVAILSTQTVAALPTQGAPWVEIDFAADLERARELARER
jgi:L-glutamine-phosphate cytidylyltransferase